MKPKFSLHILYRFILGLTSKEEEKKLLESEEINRILLRHWENPDEVKQMAQQPDEDKMWQNISKQQHTGTASHEPPVIPLSTSSRKMLFNRVLRIAALIVLPLSVIAFLYFYETDISQAQMLAETTTAGEQRKVILPDSTVVWLNSASSLRYPETFTAATREVELEGEAWFSVTASAERPFIVNTTNFDVEVTGTQFNIMAYDNEPVQTTTLIEGRVKMTASGEPIRLQAGKQAFYNVASHTTGVRNVNIATEIAWKNGQLVFDNMPLENITRQLERHYGMEITVSETVKNTYRYTMTITNETLDEVLQLIEMTSPVECSQYNNEVIISAE